jgi:hypothetical protein
MHRAIKHPPVSKYKCICGLRQNFLDENVFSESYSEKKRKAIPVTGHEGP